jgi:flagellar motor switch protein FliM
VLDPRTLGRPVHLLAEFARRFGSDLSDFLRLSLNRRYGMQLEVGEVVMERAPATDTGLRWAVFGSPVGRVGLALDRLLVLRVLHCRYGLGDTPLAWADKSGPRDAPPVTATEERLAQKLGQQLVTALASRIREGLGQPGEALAQAAADSFCWLATSTAAMGPWTLRLRIDDMAADLHVDLRFSLDDAWMGELLGRLAVDRGAPQEPLPEDTRPLANRLQVQLVAQLLHRRMPLGEILDLRVGDTIPVSLQATDVLVKDARLFTATVAEHKGKLWLTAFHDTP